MKGVKANVFFSHKIGYSLNRKLFEKRILKMFLKVLFYCERARVRGVRKLKIVKTALSVI